MSEPVIQKRLRIEVLSPLHIGDGVRLRRKQFARSGNQVVMADEARLLARVQSSPRLLDAFLQFCRTDEGLDDFLRNNRIAPPEVGYTLRAMGAIGGEVYTFIKGGDGQPYLPGSSLKGAVRSALLRASLLGDPARLRAAHEIVRKHLRDQRAGRMSGELESALFGKDQHHDWMRCFLFSDSAPVERARLQVAEVKVLSVSGEKLAVKATRSGRDMLLNPEVLTPGPLEGTLTINAHLLDANSPARRLSFDRHEKMIEDFTGEWNRAAAATIEGEIAFYRLYGDRALAEWYEKLETRRAALQANECLVQFAWGSGFIPKTATSLLDEKTFDDVRWAFNLGKFARGEDGKRRLVKPFPKSRKVVMRNRAPAEPLGWVKLSVTET